MSEANVEAPSLRESLEASFDADAKAAPPDSSAAPAAPAADAAAPAKPDASTDSAKPAADAAKPADPAKPAADVKPGDAKPPRNVAGVAKMPPGFPDVNHWNAMPETARAWIKNREAQFNTGLQKNAAAAQFGSQIAEVMRPYEWMLTAKGVPPAKVVQEVMAFNATMSNGSPQDKRQMFLRAAKHYGVDLNDIGNAEGAAAPAPAAPEIQQLQKQMRELVGYLTHGERGKAQHEAQQAWSAVESMANDPKYEHMDVVRDDMATLIERGMATTLDEAYQKAMWMRPDTRALLSSQEAAKRAEAARAAAAESTAHGGAAVAGSSKPQTGSLRSTLEAAWDRAAA